MQIDDDKQEMWPYYLDESIYNPDMIKEIWKKANLQTFDKISPSHERTIRRTHKHRQKIKSRLFQSRDRAHSRTKKQRDNKRSSQISNRRDIFGNLTNAIFQQNYKYIYNIYI